MAWVTDVAEFLGALYTQTGRSGFAELSNSLNNR